MQASGSGTMQLPVNQATSSTAAPAPGACATSLEEALEEALDNRAALLQPVLQPLHHDGQDQQQEQVAAPQPAAELAAEPPLARSLLALPRDALAATLRSPLLCQQAARLVCRDFRDAVDGGVQRLTVRLGTAGCSSAAEAVACVERTARRLPQLQVVEVQASYMRYRDARRDPPITIPELAAALRGLPAPLPVPLGLSLEGLAPPGGAAALASVGEALAACPHLSGLCALRLAGRIGEGGGILGQLVAALHATTHLACLRVLDVRSLGLRDEEVRQLAALLRGATHLHSLRELCMADLQAAPGACAALFEALGAATHLRGLEALRLASLQCDAAACRCLAAALRGGSHLARLRRLEVTQCDGTDALVALCDGLCAATHLTALQELDLGEHTGLGALAVLHDALHRAPHLRCLQYLSVVRPAEVLPEGAALNGYFGRLAGMLHDGAGMLLASLERISVWDGIALLDALAAAPCMRRLAVLELSHDHVAARDQEPDRSRAPPSLHALAAATHLRSLRHLDVSGYHERRFSGDVAVPLAAALAAASYLTGLQSLRLSSTAYRDLWGPDAASVEHVCSMLCGATHLRSLTALDLSIQGAALEPRGFEAIGAALAHATHLSRLQELDLHGALSARQAAALRQAAPHLSTVVKGLPTSASSM